MTIAASGWATYEGDALYRRGPFVSRTSNAMIVDAPATTISIALANGETVTTAALSTADDLGDDVWASAVLIDGEAAHICGWRRVQAPRRGMLPGWYAPISTASCTASSK